MEVLAFKTSILRGNSLHIDQGEAGSKVRGKAVQIRLGEALMSVFQRARVGMSTRAAGHLLTSSLFGSPSPLPVANIKHTETFPSNFYMKNLIIYTRN